MQVFGRIKLTRRRKGDEFQRFWELTDSVVASILKLGAAPHRPETAETATMAAADQSGFAMGM